MAGTGPKDARVVVVGEAPGASEDAAGTPFVGRSGQLLERLLEEAGINRDDCFITNAVKCRPQDNTTPTAKQIGACRSYLEDELASLNPRVIVVLGNVPLKAVTGVGGITKARGTNYKHGEVPVVATYHPAFGLRSPDKIDDIKLDLRKAASYLLDHPTLTVSWEWADELHDNLDRNAAIWAIDIETNAKDLDDPELEVLLLGISDGQNTSIFDQDHIELGIRRIRNAQDTHPNLRIFGHNTVGFDCEVLARKYGTYISADDTLILAHQIDERIGTKEAHGKGKLEALAVAYLNVPPWKQQVTWDWETIRTEDLQKVAQYNAEDCLYTHRLATLLLQKMEGLGVNRGYDISRGAAISFEHLVNPTGIAYDLDGSARLKGELTTDALDAHIQVQTLLGYELNLQSPKQVAKALYDDLGLEPHHYTSTGAPSTDELSIKSILVDIAGRPGSDKTEKILRGILRYRENKKLCEFLESYEELQVSGRLYPEYSVTSTVTYRTSSYNPNVQQWPHDKRVRGLLTAKPGHTLIEADYGQIEMRLAADEADSAAMLTVFRSGTDIHTATAALITGKTVELVTENERYVAKPVNFGLLYGGDTHTLRKQALLDYDLVLNNDDAQRYHDAFHDAYQLENWYARIASELRATGQVRNRIGRIRHLPNFFSPDGKARLEALRQAINFPIQSFACDVALLALLFCVKNGWPVVAFIHDALYLEVPSGEAELVAKQLRVVMTEEVPKCLKEQYNVEINVPLVVDIKMKAVA